MPLSTDQQAEIDQARGGAQPTLRPISPALEEILFQALPVLDHGFVRVVDYMGDDAAVVQAARVSYGRGTKKVSEDRGLINYLMRSPANARRLLRSIRAAERGEVSPRNLVEPKSAKGRRRAKR